MDDKTLADFLEVPVKRQENWFTKLSYEVKQDLCIIRRGYIAAAIKPRLEDLLRKMRERYQGMPDNTRRLGEFLRNQYNAYPEPANGADQSGRVEQDAGTSPEGRGRPTEVFNNERPGGGGGIEYLGSGQDG